MRKKRLTRKLTALFMSAVLMSGMVHADSENPGADVPGYGGEIHVSAGTTIIFTSADRQSGQSGNTSTSHDQSEGQAGGNAYTHSGGVYVPPPQYVQDINSGYIGVRNELSDIMERMRNSRDKQVYTDEVDKFTITSTEMTPSEQMDLIKQYEQMQKGLGIDNPTVTYITGNTEDPEYDVFDENRAEYMDKTIGGGYPGNVVTRYTPTEENKKRYGTVMDYVTENVNTYGGGTAWERFIRGIGEVLRYWNDGFIYVPNPRIQEGNGAGSDGPGSIWDWDRWFSGHDLSGNDSAPIKATINENNPGRKKMKELAREGGMNVRPDLIYGDQVMIPEKYSQRFEPVIEQIYDNYKNKAEEEEGSVPAEFNSAYLTDDITLILLQDLHLSDVTVSERNIIDYQPNTRYWSIYDYYTGDQVREEVTNNPLRQFRFTASDEGRYIIKCSAIANITETIVAEYEEFEYLIDAQSGTVLYYSERRNNNAIRLENRNFSERVDTGEFFVVRVDANGNMSVEENGAESARTERVK